MSKYALITGATSGIGYELAKIFASEGYDLVLVARHQEDLQAKAMEFSLQYGIQVEPIAKDLFLENAPFELYEEVKAKDIQIDVLVNDAGQGEYGPFLQTDIYRELDIIRLNIMASLVLTKLFLKEMVARNDGKILQLGSIGGKLPGPLQSVYHATKAFVLSHTAAIVEELKDTNVTVTALIPGATETDFFRKAHMENTKQVQEETLSNPAEVALDGYNALMAGKDYVISGFKNKLQVAMGDLLPDSWAAKMVGNKMQPSEEVE